MGKFFVSIMFLGVAGILAWVWINLPSFESFSVNDVEYRRGDADFAEGVTKARWIVGIMLGIFGMIGAAPLIAGISGRLLRPSGERADVGRTDSARPEPHGALAKDSEPRDRRRSARRRGPISERDDR